MNKQEAKEAMLAAYVARCKAIDEWRTVRNDVANELGAEAAHDLTLEVWGTGIRAQVELVY